MNILQHLHSHFGTEFDVQSAAHKRLIMDDFRDMLKAEYDTPDDSMSMSFDVVLENVQTAAKEYAKRIGRDNLYSYAKTLEAMATRTNKED